MTSRRFFALVWRLNALVLLVAGMLGTVALAAAVFFIYKDATRTRNVDDVARVAAGSEMASQATLGSFEALPGTSVLRAPLRVRQSYSLGSVSKEASSTRNFLFYDPKSRETRWLKSSMNSMIVQTWNVPDRDFDDKRTSWTLNVYAVVDTDTSGDGVLTDSDEIKIASSSPDGSGFRALVNKADRINETRLLAEDRALVIYSVGEKLMGVEFNPQRPETPADVYEIKLPKVGK